MNENYGKLENGVLTFAPSNLIIGEEQVFNATAEEYLTAGYLPIEFTPKSEAGEWQAVYTEVDGKILQSWVYEGRVHDHSNLEVLNSIKSSDIGGEGGLTPEQLADLEENTRARHTHDNKDILDAITEDMLPNFDETGGWIGRYEFEALHSDVYAEASTAKSLAGMALKYRSEPPHGSFPASPNRYYDFGEAESITINFAEIPEDLACYRNEYSFTFKSGATPTVLTFPDTVEWVNGKAPEIQPNAKYIITIVDNIASYITTSKANGTVTQSEMQKYVTSAIPTTEELVNEVLDSLSIAEEVEF